jgi:hypothetical protein
MTFGEEKVWRAFEIFLVPEFCEKPGCMKHVRKTRKAGILACVAGACALSFLLWSFYKGEMRVRKLGGGHRIVSRIQSPFEFYLHEALTGFMGLTTFSVGVALIHRANKTS